MNEAKAPMKDELPTKKQPKRGQKRPLLGKAADPILVFGATFACIAFLYELSHKRHIQCAFQMPIEVILRHSFF
jgi:hypothetical protein